MQLSSINKNMELPLNIIVHLISNILKLGLSGFLPSNIYIYIFFVIYSRCISNALYHTLVRGCKEPHSLHK